MTGQAEEAKIGSHTFLCRVDDVPENGAKRIKIEARPAVAVFHVNGNYYVTDDRCTHAAASLARGEIEEDRIICPVHSGAFHIPTGKALCFPLTEDLRTYTVLVDGEQIYADLDKHHLNGGDDE